MKISSTVASPSVYLISSSSHQWWGQLLPASSLLLTKVVQQIQLIFCVFHPNFDSLRVKLLFNSLSIEERVLDNF